MTKTLRKFIVTAHVTFSIGWLGAVVAFLVLSIAGLTSHDAETVRSAYLSMDLIGRFAILPMCFAALATGLIEALGTPWGLFRYYWVVLKFGLTILATLALLMHQFNAVSQAAKRVSGVGAERLFIPALNPLKVELVRAPTLAILALLVITALGIYKPWGLTSYGRRKVEPQAGVHLSIGHQVPSGFKAFLAVIGFFALVFVMLHLSGHGLGGHHH